LAEERITMILIIKELFYNLIYDAFVVFVAFLFVYADLRLIGIWAFWILFLFSLFVDFIRWLMDEWN